MVRKCRLSWIFLQKRKYPENILGIKIILKNELIFLNDLPIIIHIFFHLIKRFLGQLLQKKMPQIYLYNLQLQLLWICETTKGCVITKRIFFLRTILFHSNVPTNFQSFEKAVKKLLVQKSSRIAENGLKVWNSISIVI